MDQVIDSSRPATSEWHHESNIQDLLTAHLEADGWIVVERADALMRQQGRDLRLLRQGRYLTIEVKGFPSTQYRDPARRSEVKRTNQPTQARQWYSHALLAALTYYSTSDDDVAIAFPEFSTYTNLLAKTRRALEALGIGVYLVREDGSVNRAIEPRAL